MNYFLHFLYNAIIVPHLKEYAFTKITIHIIRQSFQIKLFILNLQNLFSVAAIYTFLNYSDHLFSISECQIPTRYTKPAKILSFFFIYNHHYFRVETTSTFYIYWLCKQICRPFNKCSRFFLYSPPQHFVSLIEYQQLFRRIFT